MFIIRTVKHILWPSVKTESFSTFQKIAGVQFRYRISTRLLAQIANDKHFPEKPVNEIAVYYGTLTPQIRAVKLFSLMTSFTGIAIQPMLYKQLLTMNSIPIFVVAYSFIGFFTFVTPLLLHILTRKYITELVYKPDIDKYEATTLNFFLIKKKVLFSLDDVSVPEIPKMFTTFAVHGKGLFVDSRMFQDPSHYGKIMGYDKPLDLKLFKTSLNETEDIKKD